MENSETNRQEKDPALWALAKKRAEFKKGLVYYFVINAFLWMIWLLSSNNNRWNDIPWPVWPTAGWGIAMIIEYFSVYRYPKQFTAEKEYEKLKNQNK